MAEEEGKRGRERGLDKVHKRRNDGVIDFGGKFLLVVKKQQSRH